jgi:hypothetical protein
MDFGGDVMDSSLAAPCFQVKMEGPCKGNFSRYSYDQSDGQCKPFTYGGCKGNQNNFLSEEECQLRCRGKDRQRGKTI